MNDLERRALLGDAEAQRECSERKITLPCPLCGGQADIVVSKDAGMIICKRCKLYKPFTIVLDGVNKARRVWNTRPAPPIGRCEECAYWDKNTGECADAADIEVAYHRYTEPDFFCGDYKPKGGEENDRTTVD